MLVKFQTQPTKNSNTFIETIFVLANSAYGIAF